MRIVISDETGALDYMLGVFHRHDVNLGHIEILDKLASCSPHAKKVLVKILFDGLPSEPRIQVMLRDLKKSVVAFMVEASYTIPWIPTRLQDLELLAEECMFGGDKLEADHPGFSDAAYVQRRQEISQLAQTYKHGDPVPYVKYQPDEIKTWSTVFEKLTDLYPTHACTQYQRGLMDLIANTEFGPSTIPQLNEISEFVTSKTGFSLRPVKGLLSSRYFLYGLALRVFHSTQYIRHHAAPFYTPEPDIIHEMMGHVPMFLDPDFADFSQAIGLASLGASDEFVQHLATVYWYTVEFGLIRQHAKPRAFGAGLLSSFGELEYCLTDKPKTLPFDPFNVEHDYPICSFQPLYYIANDFVTMRKQIEEFSRERNTERYFTPVYNKFDRTIQLLAEK